MEGFEFGVGVGPLLESIPGEIEGNKMTGFG